MGKFSNTRLFSSSLFLFASCSCSSFGRASSYQRCSRQFRRTSSSANFLVINTRNKLYRKTEKMQIAISFFLVRIQCLYTFLLRLDHLFCIFKKVNHCGIQVSHLCREYRFELVNLRGNLCKCRKSRFLSRVSAGEASIFSQKLFERSRIDLDWVNLLISWQD